MPGNMGLTNPTDHDSTSIWGAALNADLDLIQDHDHTTGKGVQVPSAALKINADVSWSFGGTNYAVKDCKAIDFAAVAASTVAGFAGALFVNSADSELYYRTVGGSNVKFTNGAALNFAAFVGGIGGDYSAVSALESYDDATHRYLFQQQGSPRPWAGVAHGNIDLYEQAVSITNKVTIKSPSALAASYSITWPAAVPAAVAVAMVSAAGVMTFPTSPVLATDANITLSGTGYLKRAKPRGRIVHFLPSLFYANAGVPAQHVGAAGTDIPVSSTMYYPLGTVNDETLLGVGMTVYLAAGGTPTYSLVTSGAAGLYSADIAGSPISTASSTFNIGVTTPAVPAGPLWMKIVTDGATTVSLHYASVSTRVD